MGWGTSYITPVKGKGDVVSESTYEKLFVAVGIIPFLRFSIFETCQTDEALIACP